MRLFRTLGKYLWSTSQTDPLSIIDSQLVLHLNFYHQYGRTMTPTTALPPFSGTGSPTYPEFQQQT